MQMKPYYQDNRTTIFHGDCLQVLKELPSESVQCCVTSPPYLGLRDYQTATWEGGSTECDHSHFLGGNGESSAKQVSSSGTQKYQYRDVCQKCGAVRVDSQFGLERTPDEYISNMVGVFREVKRVLRSDGTMWLNMGDSYAGGGGFCPTAPSTAESKSGKYGTSGALIRGRIEPQNGMKSKDLCGIPWLLAFALRADGWYLRSDIIWHKPNPMPESVTDRPTKSHEYIFLLTKSAQYYYDAEAIKEPWTCDRDDMRAHGVRTGEAYIQQGRVMNNSDKGERKAERDQHDYQGGRNKRTVWTVTTSPFPEAHFATFPPDLIKPCILAGTSQRGCCARCGSPIERIVETNNPSKYAAGDDRGWANTHQKTSNPQSSKSMHRNGSNVASSAVTVGWQPTCNCMAETKPCTVLDPFFGAGTTALVSQELDCQCIGIELNAEYIEIAKKRLRQDTFNFT